MTDKPDEAKGTLIIQREHGGHRLGYVRILVDAHLAISPDVIHIVLTPSGASSAEYDHHLGDPVRKHKGHVRIHQVDPDRWVSGYEAIISETRVRHVIVPEGDNELRALGRHHTQKVCSLSILIMRTPFRARPREVIGLAAKRALLWRVTRKWKHVDAYFLTDTFGTVTSRPMLRGVQPLLDPPLIEPAEGSRRNARSILDLPKETSLIGIVGTISERKNADILLRALQRSEHAYWHVLLAGAPSPAMTREIELLPPDVRERLHLIQGYLSDEKIATAVRALDCLTVLHELDAPSGTMTLAVRSQTKVIVGTSPWLRKIAKNLPGSLATRHSTQSLLTAISNVLASPTGATSSATIPNIGSLELLLRPDIE